MKKRIIYLILSILLLTVAVVVYLKLSKRSEYSNTKMNVVLSLEDKITKNSIWCGTFNLIWNDLKNDLAKQDIIFNEEMDIVNNLNKGTFNVNNLSERSFYKKYGTPTKELKEEIEKSIKEKFNEESDILDDFNWEEYSAKDYFLYAMLKKVFEYPKEFDELDKGTFKNTKDVMYFGINKKTEDDVRSQVEVLYYNSNKDFAVKLITKSDDEVIIASNINSDSFLSTYKEILKKESKYYGNKTFGENDILSVPNIEIKLIKEFTDLENKEFMFSNG